MKKCFFCCEHFFLDPTVTAFPVHSFDSLYIHIYGYISIYPYPADGYTDILFPPFPPQWILRMHFIDVCDRKLLVSCFKEREEEKKGRREEEGTKEGKMEGKRSRHSQSSCFSLLIKALLFLNNLFSCNTSGETERRSSQTFDLCFCQVNCSVT